MGHWKKTPLAANGPGTSALVLEFTSECVNESLFKSKFFFSASISFRALDLIAANELKKK